MSAGDRDPIEALAEVRARTGSLHATFEFADAVDAETAFRAIETVREGLSAWRTTTPERDAWRVTVMGEEGSRREFELARDQLRQAGGRIVGLPAESVELFRDRRFATALDAAAAGRREFRTRARYGRGVRLGPGGTLLPWERPQG